MAMAKKPSESVKAGLQAPTAIDVTAGMMINLNISGGDDEDDDVGQFSGSGRALRHRRSATLGRTTSQHGAHGDGEPPARIEDIPELKRNLEKICTMVFKTLGRQQAEGAYQRALEIELKLRGVTVTREVAISIMYRGEKISSRRIDLLLELADGSRAIVETKAIQTLTRGSNTCAQQIEYYLDVFGVDHGFLVNFPHSAGYPPPPSGDVFLQEPICGMVGPLSDVRTRGRTSKGSDGVPEIVYFQRANGPTRR